MLKFIPTMDEANLFNTHVNEAHQFAAGDSYLFEMSKSVEFFIYSVKFPNIYVNNIFI